jgi:fatty acid-binding protein DegV
VTDSTCDLPEKANTIFANIKHLLPDSEVYSMDITPVIGVHISPGAVGYAIISKTPIE